MKLTPKKYFYVLIALVVLLAGGGGAGVYFGNILLTKRSKDVVDLKLLAQGTEAQQEAYRTVKAEVEKYSYLNDIINSALPQDKDQARSVREIARMASESGITLQSITFPNSTLGLAPAAGGGTATPGATTASPITQAKPITGLNGVYSLEATVTPLADTKSNIVTYGQLVSFLEKIEQNRRAMRVSSLQVNPLGQNVNDSINFSLVLNIYIKP